MRRLLPAVLFLLSSCATEKSAPELTKVEGTRDKTLAPVAPARSEPLRVGGDVLPPVPIARPYPKLPAGLEMRSAGPIVFELVLNERGQVESARVVRDGTDPSLAHYYLESFKEWRFEPATRAGTAVSVRYNVVANIDVR